MKYLHRGSRRQEGDVSAEPVGQVTGLSVEEAQREFTALVESERERALWHLRPSLAVDILRPEADTILDSIARHGTRAVWVRVRGLKRWRLQHTR
jgi:hypothetical protein